MAEENLIFPDMGGVDMQRNPLNMPQRKVVSATNLSFDEGVVRTRPSIVHNYLGVSGVFQGATNYSPSKGLSAQSFSESVAGIAFSVSGKIMVAGVDNNGCISCEPFQVCKDVLFDPRSEVYLYQAENYLIGQSRNDNTVWWDGKSGCTVTSNGIGDCSEEDAERNLNSVCDERVHYLANGASVGIYIHGRVHQAVGNFIYVGDIIHKRGWKKTDDILSMEEQMSNSHGSPLSTPSQSGGLLALATLPQTETPHGEGDLIAYYENAVFAHNTFESPRESRFTAEGKQISQGWDTKRLSNMLLNTVSAVGRFAVAVTPRDHFFRSRFGLHWLRRVIGSESTNDESLNNSARDVSPLLDLDDPALLHGNTTGFWMTGDRMLSSVGMKQSQNSVSPVGKGFVVFNRALQFSEQNIPMSAWEGLWLPDKAFQAVCCFLNVGLVRNSGGFGWITAADKGIFFSSFGGNDGADYAQGAATPIKWSLQTRHSFARDVSRTKTISDGRLEFISRSHNSFVRVSLRSDINSCWQVWRELTFCKGNNLRNEVLDKPSEKYREATWFQFKIEGDGDVEIRNFTVDYTSAEKKAGKARCSELTCCSEDFFGLYDS